MQSTIKIARSFLENPLGQTSGENLGLPKMVLRLGISHSDVIDTRAYILDPCMREFL